MSSLATRRRAYVPPRRGRWYRLRYFTRLPLPDPRVTIGAGVTVAIVATAFASRGGSQVGRTTWTEVWLILLGALLCAAALVVPRSEHTPARLRGGWALAGFTALSIYTALSITWSLMPNDSWLETTRTLAYLSAFAGGLALGRLAPGRWSQMVIAIGLAATILCFWSLLTKVFPAALAANEPFARLRPPTDYWNSVGLTAALGFPPMLWLAARRSGHAAFNALAWPALGVLVTCLLLAYSRGALLALGVGLVVWLAIVPLRLRASLALGGVLFATVPLVAWCFAQDGLAADRATLALRIDAGQGFGALLLLLLVTLTVAGLAIGFLSDHHPPGQRARMRVARLLVGALAVVPAVAILMLANAPGGVDGQVSKAYKQMTDPAVSGPSNSPDRLTQTASGRARFWNEALKVHAHAPLLGTGAGSYGTMRLRYRHDMRTTRHAHGYVVQTLSDLGWVGLGISLITLVGWLAAARGVLGLRRRDRGLGWDAERVGLAALACVVLVFGLHSTIDWTWFVPANAVPALLCAGWVASRATLRERRAAEPQPPPSERIAPVRALAAAALLGVALVAAWSALQPVRSNNAQAAAFERLDRGALDAAASIAQIAHERNPLSVDPLFELSAIEQARGRVQPAVRALEQAVDLEPANPETWRRLGRMRLTVLGDPQGALRAFRAALFLDPRSTKATSDVITTSRIISAGG